MIQYLQRLRAKRGFTLMELIIVIAIVGVLALILIPVLSGVVQNAQNRSVESGLQTVLDLALNFETELSNNGELLNDGSELADMHDGNGPQTLKQYILSQCPEIKSGGKKGAAVVLGWGRVQEVYYREDFVHAGWRKNEGYLKGQRFDPGYGIAPLGDVIINLWPGT